MSHVDTVNENSPIADSQDFEKLSDEDIGATEESDAGEEPVITVPARPAAKPAVRRPMPPDDGQIWYTLGKSYFNKRERVWLPSRWYTRAGTPASELIETFAAIKPNEFEIKGSGNWFCPATYAYHDARYSQNAQQMSMLVFDIDGGQTFDDAVARLRRANLTAALYTSWSHSIPKDGIVAERFRIIIPLARRYLFEDHGPSAIALWKRVYREAGDALGMNFDPACCDPARLFYLPARPPGEDRSRRHFVSGNPFDLAPYIERAKEGVQREHAARAERIAKARDNPPAEIAMVRAALESIPSETSRAEWLPIIFAMHAEYADTPQEEAAIAALIEWSEPASNYDDGCVEAVWNSAQKGGGGVSIGTLFHKAKQYGFDKDAARLQHTRDLVAALRSRLRPSQVVPDKS